MNQQIPVYVSLAFLIALLFPIYMIANLARKNTASSKSTFVFYGIIAFYSIYLLVVGIACINGAFDEVSLPPKIILLTTLPLLLFLVGFVFNTSLCKEIIKTTPVSKLIRLHLFRVIGSFFIILMLLQLLPKTFALIAGMGDVITALSSLWVAKSIEHKKIYAQTVALAWNTFGFLDILITSATAIILTKISIDTGALGVEVLATFPFCFIPAFAPATIIFLHLNIYRKLLSKNFQ